MNEIFKLKLDKLPKYFEQLLQSDFLTRNNLIGVPEKGVYVFYEDENPIYVGRSNRVKFRLGEHGRLGSKSNDVNFAFKLAKEEAEKLKLDIKRIKAALVSDKEFAICFTEAKRRVASMTIKVVEINDPADQTLFEIYAAVVLSTKYNSFETT